MIFKLQTYCVKGAKLLYKDKTETSLFFTSHNSSLKLIHGSCDLKAHAHPLPNRF